LIDCERKKRIIDALRDSRLDAVACGSPSEVLLLTGYWPVMGASVAVFRAEGDVHVVLPEDEIELAEKTSATTLVPYKPAGLTKLTTMIEALAAPLSSLTAQLGLSKATIGIQKDEGMQPSTYAASTRFHCSLIDLLRELQPEANHVACDNVLEGLKASKTPKEIELMRTAANIAASGFGAAAQAIQVGRRESEVAADIHAAFQACSHSELVQRSYGYFFCMSGPNSASAAAAYARTRQRRIEDGDLVMIHANTCADGYWTDITRTYTAGSPSEQQHTMRTAVREARKTALGCVRPGVHAREIDAAARKAMDAHGFGEAFKHSTGHGVGFAAANPNGLPRIHPCSPDVLDEGMTFNVEPAAYFDGYGGMRHCDVVAVTRAGGTVLTDF
jgi:Xaa-Pro aminopeptidase